MQRRFVSDVSHELRTPLTTIRMAADVLHEARDVFAPDDRPERRAAAGPARPVRGPARRPARDQPLRRRRRRPGDRDRPTSARSSTGSSTGCGRWPSVGGARLDGHGPGRPPARTSTTRRVERIVRNLVVNAIEHGEGAAGRHHRRRRRGGRRRVGARPRRRARPRPKQRLVFNRFWRADPARARSTGGHRPGPGDRARGRPPARWLAPGLGELPVRARTSGSRSRGAPGSCSAAHRCRSSHPTPRRPYAPR